LAKSGQLAPNPSSTELSAKSTRLGVPGNGFREVGTPSQAHRVLRQRLGVERPMILSSTTRKQGQRGCRPFPLHPQSPPSASASLRTISLDDSEHLLHNHRVSVASLRLLFTFAPERRSACHRNERSPSPEYPQGHAAGVDRPLARGNWRSPRVQRSTASATLFCCPSKGLGAPQCQFTQVAVAKRPTRLARDADLARQTMARSTRKARA